MNFIKTTEKILKKKGIILDYLIFSDDNVYKAELDIGNYNGGIAMAYSYYLEKYEEAIDLYDIYIHKQFSTIAELYDFLQKDTRIDLEKFSELLVSYN